MKHETNETHRIGRRRFGALAGCIAAACLLLSQPSPGAAQEVSSARKVGSGVAANPQDRVVFKNRLWEGVEYLFVITESGDVFGQRLLYDGKVGPALRVGAVQRLDGNVRWVLPDLINGGIYVVRTAGDVVYHPLTVSIGVPESVRFGAATAVRVPGPVGVNREDRRALLLADRVVVFRSDGEVGFHRIVARNEWSAGAPMAAESVRPVASNPQDKWLIPLGGADIGVVTSGGELFVHKYDRTRNVVLPATRANTQQPIAANPRDRFVLSDAYGRIYVITNNGEVWEHSILAW